MVPDPFLVLGFVPHFRLDLSLLKDRHRDLSKALHPDKHAAASATERRASLGKAIEVNEAFRTLKDPVARAEAILNLRGIAISESNAGHLDEEFLLQNMELRESLGEARANRDTAAIARLTADANRSAGALIDQLGQCLDDPAGDATNAIALVAKLRYAQRFLEELSAAEDLLAETNV